MDSGNRWATSAHCAGAVDLVLSGDISAQNGVARLVVFRHVGSLDQRKCAVSALQFLAHNPDVWVARATRCALHDLFVEDSWRLFTQNRDAMAQVRLDYDEVVTDTGYQVAASVSPTIPSAPVPPEIVLDQDDEVDADSLESF